MRSKRIPAVNQIFFILRQYRSISANFKTGLFVDPNWIRI
jgi:hypothetical protein